MNEHLSEDEKRKRLERERKKAEVRARLEATAASRKKKGGFITPERKKKLRLLLRRKAAEELKREQEVKAKERRNVIEQRVGEPKSLDNLNEDQVIQVIKQYHDRWTKLENEKFDLEYQVRVKDYEIAETTSRVCDMRGKFVRPPLKKTPKYEAKIERMILNARKEIGFTEITLKAVKKDQMVDPKETKRTEPEWSWKNRDASGSAEIVIGSCSGSVGGLLTGNNSASSNNNQHPRSELRSSPSPSPNRELKRNVSNRSSHQSESEGADQDDEDDEADETDEEESE